MHARPCSKYRAILMLLADDPNLLVFFFGSSTSQLAAPSATLLREARAFTSSEQVLVRLALDMWDGSGKCTLEDVLAGLDETRLQNAISATAALVCSLGDSNYRPV